ncbi:hypothetical protein Avbf_17781 [Armadillidium vulgare]|nr:hypothetical protein Avbf_17781 [Armadillidium vulgare]
MFNIQEFENSLKVPDEIEYLHTPCPVDNGNQSSDLDDDYLEIVELAKELGIESFVYFSDWFTNLGGGVMYQEGFNRTISVQSILLPRHRFMKGISVHCLYPSEVKIDIGLISGGKQKPNSLENSGKSYTSRTGKIVNERANMGPPCSDR